MSLDQFIEQIRLCLPGITAEDIADALYLVRYLIPSNRLSDTPIPETDREPSISSVSSNLLDNERNSTSNSTIKSPSLYSAVAEQKYQSQVPQPAAGLYASPPPSREGMGLDFRTPHAPVLPDRTGLMRGLRSLFLRISSHTSQELDETQTVQWIADTRVWLPVMRPRAEPRFRVVLLLDDTPSMAIWRSTVLDFFQILERHSALRNPRAYRLSFIDGKPVLRPGLRDNTNLLRSAQGELADPTGRTLILGGCAST